MSNNMLEWNKADTLPERAHMTQGGPESSLMILHGGKPKSLPWIGYYDLEDKVWRRIAPNRRFWFGWIYKTGFCVFAKRLCYPRCTVHWWYDAEFFPALSEKMRELQNV